MQGGAISANVYSTLTLNGSISFTSNGCYQYTDINGDNHGGAIYLSVGSAFSIFPHKTVCWENNLEGAIYVSDVNRLIYCPRIARHIPNKECFLKLPGQNLSRGTDVRLVFKNNSADDAGSVLYGGAIDNCKLTGLDSYSSGELFDMIVHIEDGNDYNTTSKISSDPLRICPCKNNLPDCSRSWYYRVTIPYPHTVYPGETFQISVVAAGQRNGTVSSTVRSTVRTNTIMDISPVNLLDYQYLQQTNNTCTKINYTVFSLSQKVRILLHPESSLCSSGSIYFLLKLNQTCPPGFNNSESARSCICEPRLAQYTHQCNLTNGLGQISRDADKTFWVGYNSQSHELILHPHCPFDYCVNEAKVFPLNNTDIQCAYNRSGLLCGACKEGYKY